MSQRQDIKDKINTFHLVDQEILAAVPFENPLAKRKDVSLKELVQYPFIYYSEKSGLRPQLNQMFNKANIKPKILIGAVEDYTIIGFVYWNYGVAVVPNLPQLNPNEVKFFIDLKITNLTSRSFFTPTVIFEIKSNPVLI